MSVILLLTPELKKSICLSLFLPKAERHFAFRIKLIPRAFWALLGRSGCARKKCFVRSHNPRIPCASGKPRDSRRPSASQFAQPLNSLKRLSRDNRIEVSAASAAAERPRGRSRANDSGLLAAFQSRFVVLEGRSSRGPAAD